MLKYDIINNKFRKTYSDVNYYIKKLNEDTLYTDAVDLLTNICEYVETDIKIEEVEEEIKENE